jgi:hypothetical protein
MMKQQDIGPILVISDHNEARLSGILTDRDIAIEVVAEGRDPYSTRVDSIMSTDPVTCSENDDVMEAVKRMADYQVRRIPVVDDSGRLVGIISQADIARHTSEEQTGEMVEEISQPWGMGEWPGGRQDSAQSRGRSAASGGAGGLDTVSALAIGALCVGFGAGLMFMFDPKRGSKRRTQLVNKGAELWNHRTDVLDRAKNLASTAASKVTGNPAPSEANRQAKPEPQFANQ